jgi:DHA2 family multidrug resistance protein-like MFS transporter
MNMTSRAGRREWIGLAVLALPTLLLSLDTSVLYLALPHLSADLRPTSTQQLWIMDIYGFMIAGFLVTMGTLGDKIGRRRLLLTGAAAFGVASVLAAYSTSPEMLIATRALLGIAGATLMPSTLALISNMFADPRQRATAIGIWLSCFMGGMVIGPAVGGLLLVTFWWGAAFLLGVPVMLVLLIAGPRLLPEYRDPAAGRVDLISVGLSLATVLPVIYGLKEIAKHGLEVVPVAALLVGGAFGYVFTRRQRRLAHPLIDLSLLRNRPFATSLSIMLLTGVVMSGTSLFVALYLQMVQGLTPLWAGLWMIPQAVAMIVGSMLTPLLARRIRPGVLISAGLVISAAGISLLIAVGSTGGLPIVVASFTIASLGMAAPVTLVTDLIVGSAPPERAGSASSMSETSGELGIALGVATLGSVGTAVYRQVIDIPPGVPDSVAGPAREGIEGALGTELLGAAREAFTSGLNVTAAVATIVLLGLAIVAGMALRHVRSPGESADPEPAESPGRVAPVTGEVDVRVGPSLT